jgi:transposase
MGGVFVGHDWAEAHHDVYVEDGDGRRLAKARLPEGVEGVARFHELVAPFVDEPADVVVATETDRGLFVGALVAAGYTVVAVNPLSTSRYRERHSTSGAKSDPGDARTLAELARTDAHNHRPIAGDTELAEAVKVLARAHQSLIWTRQRQTNQLRSTLREFYPGALACFTTSTAATPWRCWPSPPRRRSAARCPDRRSPRPSGAGAVSAASRSGRPRSRPPCARLSWRRRPS